MALEPLPLDNFYESLWSRRDALCADDADVLDNFAAEQLAIEDGDPCEDHDLCGLETQGPGVELLAVNPVHGVPSSTHENPCANMMRTWCRELLGRLEKSDFWDGFVKHVADLSGTVRREREGT